ncbi:MAG: VOC family protein [Pseudomonadota bacterium]
MALLLAACGQPAGPPAPPGTDTGSVYHVGIVVDDLDTAMARWTGDHAAGPFFVARHFPFHDAVLDGSALSPDVSLAFGYAGDFLIELIERHDSGPSPYERAGLHHVAYLSDDVGQSVAAAESGGYDCRFRAGFPGGRLAYCRVAGATGADYVEYVQRSDGIDALLAMMYEASRGWDGADPVRELAF